MFTKWRDKRIKQKLIKKITNEILDLQDVIKEWDKEELSWYNERINIYKNALNVLNNKDYSWWDLWVWSFNGFNNQIETIQDKNVLNEAIRGRLEAYIKIRCWAERYL